MKDNKLDSCFIGIRNESLPPLNKVFHCMGCVKFETSSCPYPDSDMRYSKCNHYDSKRNYWETI